ncbi:hypothetical protein [Rhodovastum atsumiense]|uniref:DUF3616 domain-containing protein n=1 Tax=Rhodovastum atsumiense TaxID=504468 RepID=A0A5M6ISB8_9PROT|nr:hypothetical protein [Rhodovastum atsumiense]KAA5611203.1 hypothetical protein F1189_15655 [Rhodovastum atsumiense]
MRALIAWLCLLLAVPVGTPARAEFRQHPGLCAASVALAWPEDGFAGILVASATEGRLRLLAPAGGAAPRRLGDDLGAFLRQGRRGQEAGLRAGAWLGGRIYWIGRAGAARRGGKGGQQATPDLLFATTVRRNGDGAVVLAPLGLPLELQPALARARLGEDDGEPDTTEAELQGLVVAGLVAGPGGASLLLVLRQPQHEGRAALLPFVNPVAVVEQGAEPVFGEPLPLDLGGMEIRAIVHAPARGEYVILAGADPAAPRGEAEATGRRRSGLFRWSGRPQERPVPLAGTAPALAGLHDLPGGFVPAALVVHPSGRQALLLGDDTEREMRPGLRCRQLPPARRHLRSVVLDLP